MMVTGGGSAAIVPYKPRVIIAIILMTISTLLGVAARRSSVTRLTGIRAARPTAAMDALPGHWRVADQPNARPRSLRRHAQADIRSELFRHLHRLTLNFYSNYSVCR
jgi:hypothetical protein